MILGHKMHTVMPYVITNFNFMIYHNRSITNNDTNNDWSMFYSMLDTELFYLILNSMFTFIFY